MGHGDCAVSVPLNYWHNNQQTNMEINIEQNEVKLDLKAVVINTTKKLVAASGGKWNTATSVRLWAVVAEHLSGMSAADIIAQHADVLGVIANQSGYRNLLEKQGLVTKGKLSQDSWDF